MLHVVTLLNIFHIDFVLQSHETIVLLHYIESNQCHFLGLCWLRNQLADQKCIRILFTLVGWKERSNHVRGSEWTNSVLTTKINFPELCPLCFQKLQTDSKGVGNEESSRPPSFMRMDYSSIPSNTSRPRKLWSLFGLPPTLSYSLQFWLTFEIGLPVSGVDHYENRLDCKSKVSIYGRDKNFQEINNVIVQWEG